MLRTDPDQSSEDDGAGETSSSSSSQSPVHDSQDVALSSRQASPVGGLDCSSPSNRILKRKLDGSTLEGKSPAPSGASRPCRGNAPQTFAKSDKNGTGLLLRHDDNEGGLTTRSMARNVKTPIQSDANLFTSFPRSHAPNVLPYHAAPLDFQYSQLMPQLDSSLASQVQSSLPQQRQSTLQQNAHQNLYPQDQDLPRKASDEAAVQTAVARELIPSYGAGNTTIESGGRHPQNLSEDMWRDRPGSRTLQRRTSLRDVRQRLQRMSSSSPSKQDKSHNTIQFT